MGLQERREQSRGQLQLPDQVWVVVPGSLLQTDLLPTHHGVRAPLQDAEVENSTVVTNRATDGAKSDFGIGGWHRVSRDSTRSGVSG